jgi:adenylate kinase
MQAGDLVPDDVVSQLVFARLEQPDAERGAVLDGYPRNLAQAEALDRWLADHGGAIRAAIYLEAPEDELVRRLLQRGEVSGRADDRAQTTPRRLQVFLKDMPPVLQYYEARGLLDRIDGTQPIETVHRQIVEKLGQRPVP